MRRCEAVATTLVLSGVTAEPLGPTASTRPRSSDTIDVSTPRGAQRGGAVAGATPRRSRRGAPTRWRACTRTAVERRDAEPAS